MFSIKIEPNTLYSLTTTTGQKKGSVFNKVPAFVGFPENYSDDFENNNVGSAPKYFCDQAGAFEVYKNKAGSKTLRQVVVDPLLVWDQWGPCDPEPFSEIGDSSFSDYEVSCDVLIENKGTAKIIGRISAYDPKKVLAGYTFTVNSDGKWNLLDSFNSIASGTVSYPSGKWHSLKLRFNGSLIKAYIDSIEITSVTNTSYSKGFVGLGSDKNYVQFDNFKINSLKE